MKIKATYDLIPVNVVGEKKEIERTFSCLKSATSDRTKMLEFTRFMNSNFTTFHFELEEIGMQIKAESQFETFIMNNFRFEEVK